MRLTDWWNGAWPSLRRLLLAGAIVGVAWLFREQLPEIAWPAVVAFAVWRFDEPLRALLGRVRKFEGAGVKFDLEQAAGDVRSVQQAIGAP